MADDVPAKLERMLEEVAAGIDAVRLEWARGGPARYAAENRALVEERDTALRRKEMFHRALYIYLQEREGPAGVNAPTPETLALIRELINGGS